MKKRLAIAVLLLASTAAQAQYTFDYGGRTITIDPDRGTVSIPGVYDNTGKKAKRSRSEDGDPAVEAFLEFLASDIQHRPDEIQALTGSLEQRLRELTVETRIDRKNDRIIDDVGL